MRPAQSVNGLREGSGLGGCGAKTFWRPLGVMTSGGQCKSAAEWV